MDGVWLPAGEETPAARGFPDSRHTPRPGIAKGVAFSPLARRRSPEVNKTPLSARRNRIKQINHQNPRPFVGPFGGSLTANNHRSGAQMHPMNGGGLCLRYGA